LVAAVSCGVVGGCVVTSAEEFPEETNVPPVVVDTPGFANGSIITFDKNSGNELRLLITVRDENINDDVEIQARLSVLGQPTSQFICPDKLPPGTQPVREQFPLVVERSKIQPGACTMVEVAVSSRFVRPCSTHPEYFGLPGNNENDVGHATFWIWDMTGNPLSDPAAAQALLGTCQTVTVTRAATPTAMPTGQ